MATYRTYANKQRKHGKPLLVLFTPDEKEYLRRIIKDRGGNMALYIRGKALPKGWRRNLDELRQEQGPLAVRARIS